MIRFANQPDTVMTAIVATALGIVADYIETSVIDEQAEFMQLDDYFPKGSQCLQAQQLHDTLRELRAKLIAPQLFMVTDLHFLLIYEALEYFCTEHNDSRIHEIAVQ